MSGRRVAFVLVVVVLLAAGIGMAVLGGDRGQATELGGYAGSLSGDPVSAATASPAPAATVVPLVDPAKVEPNLDKFTSKDPFAQMSGTIPPLEPVVPTEEPTVEPTASPDDPSDADVTIQGSSYNVKPGDETPTDDPVFRVASITPDGVTFELLNSQQFDDGSSSVTVAEGETASVTNADTGTTYDITVDSLNYGDDDGGDGDDGDGDDATGHTIELLSINTQNGTHTATFEIDGATYADQGAGSTFTTDWGEVRVLAIDAGAQTATILHGDNTLVLHVGQTLEK